MNKRTICAAITRRAGEPENTLQNRALKRPLLLSLSKNKTNAFAAGSTGSASRKRALRGRLQ
jgi:hypothetical protein